MNAYLFTGQGSQYAGMGSHLLALPNAQQWLTQANEVLGFDIADVMINGTDEDLRQTRVTQPAVFLFSVIKAKLSPNFAPQMLAGHSLGELSALVAGGALSFDDGLRLVYQRATAMQAACDATPSTMAAVIGFDDAKTEEVLATITDDIVVPANYNCPGQLVISGSTTGIQTAMVRLKEAGARRVLPLPVGGAFHSPLMEPARVELEAAINSTTFNNPICPVYQNVTANAVTNPDEIKKNLIAQLTAPVKWTQTVIQMINDGATSFTEVGPGKVLQGLVKKVNAGMETVSA